MINLTYLRLRFTTNGLRPPVDVFLALRLFSSAHNLRTLSIVHPVPTLAERLAPPRGLVSSLQQLRSLSLPDTHFTPHVISILDGINPPQLTRLSLKCNNLSPSLLQSITRFSELRDLYLRVTSGPVGLWQLFSTLTGLMNLRLGTPRHVTWDQDSKETLVSHIDEWHRRFGWPSIDVEVVSED